MITVDRLKALSSMCNYGLAKVLADSGYTGCSFEAAEFLGLTNAGQFCYRVKYWDDGGGPELEQRDGKVFVSYDHEKDVVTADF